jgi:hypothetical protein
MNKEVSLPKDPNEIVSSDIQLFESSGRIYRAIAWLKHAKKEKNVSSLEYAALEVRLGIEQLLFEQLLLSVGTNLDQEEYINCEGQAKKLRKMIDKLNPSYERLVDFSRALQPPELSITKWDNQKLVKFSGQVSKYLHWSGSLDKTVQCSNWFSSGVSIVGEAVEYVWSELANGQTGCLDIQTISPQMLDIWQRFNAQKIDFYQMQIEVINSKESQC